MLEPPVGGVGGEVQSPIAQHDLDGGPTVRSPDQAVTLHGFAPEQEVDAYLCVGPYPGDCEFGRSLSTSDSGDVRFSLDDLPTVEYSAIRVIGLSDTAPTGGPVLREITVRVD